ncbi:amidohydrolase/deacetylase family metallohydrolase [Ketogulonicigenium vulgare]|uniref:Amidohydrolase n=1 Tax=Ketogulonicigenium vulgare (strain WSH-001) TaxID=759362 RepID=F9Y3N4_KETVW|nr:amidohydrolase/deacetylase family metallohydrolase [Ketogulonicigenium vulgare]ADO42197.1 dihydroorotase [Ketogulonicigenium vulgare Y25]AEM40398.1 Amidohydrolase [Ketogulonicigenium vulgare WSH-001]ALJ80587.1 dihydroorotase [Ketogulonicigenium vulgare]ANW33406.1 dihydroorotase [Ketogulonicigenium vulgare]AOZ54113.1 dihydroorotase [Ketogulonicigenium vulgare]
MSQIQGRKYDLVLKGGHLLDARNGIDDKRDIAILNGKIAAVAESLDPAGARVRDMAGCYVMPGLIDIHTHVYHKATSLSVDPDMISRRSATTTLVDAGSAGAGNYDGFRDFVMKQSDYRILAFLNISFPGIFGFDHNLFIGEATLAEMLPVDRCIAKIEANRDKIVGVKVRIGGPATGRLGLGALELALEAAEAVGLPLMTHIGGPPPSYAEVVAMLRPGDILTHCYRPDPNSALGADGQLLPEVQAARERGVLFDIAHGMGAFGFEVAEKSLALGFKPDLISSDVHVVSLGGPGYDLLHTMSKLLNCGMSVAEVVAASANAPALAVRRPELGHLGVGAIADITALQVVDAGFTFTDVRGQTRKGDRLFHPMAVYQAGREAEIARRTFEEPFFHLQPCACGGH